MIVGLRIAASENFIEPKAPVVYALSKQFEICFAKKFYSDQVKELDISLLMTLERPGYEDWYKPKKPSYIEHKNLKSKLTGEVITIDHRLQIEFRLDESAIGRFLQGSEIDTQKYLINYLADRFEQEVKLPAKVKSFRVSDFIADLRQFKARLTSS